PRSSGATGRSRRRAAAPSSAARAAASGRSTSRSSGPAPSARAAARAAASASSPASAAAFPSSPPPPSPPAAAPPSPRPSSPDGPGGAAPFLDRFSATHRHGGDDFTTISTLALASAYSPAADGSGAFALPFHPRTCEPVASVLARWLAFDPVQRIAREPAALR